ncbi:MAG: (2Fe-2S)-binding protein [Candidatus Sericytochromatia bacterium]|nr:(2Fe-2S)-binding protein [Candidatus Sericytochromatia bacterium]
MPVIKIDDVEYDVEAGQNLIQAATKVGIEIPHYCYHPGLSVSGNCRMCLVEVKGPRGTMAQIACNTPITEGLEVVTASDTVKKMRQGVMEFLLLNHPIDCPICDQAGECGLQDYYMEYGLYTNRSTVPKVNKDKVVDVGPLVILDQERCILCSRCVRFCAEVTETHELTITHRGEKSRIETFPGKPLDNAYSGNVVDICPVGALTSKDFRFKKRVWFLSTANSLCTGCAKGCNVYLDHENKQTYRYRPRFNAEVNEWWICDEGRLSYKVLHHNRLDQALIKGQASPLDAAVKTAADLLQEAVQRHGESAVLAIGSSTASLEDNFMLKHLLLQGASSEAVYAPNFEHWGEADKLLKEADKTPNTAGVKLLGIETEPEVLTQALKQPELKLVICLDNDAEALRTALADRKVQVIYLGSHATPLSAQADVSLPITAHAEHYASYVNSAERLQKVEQAYFPTSEARPAWKLISALFKPLLTAPPLYDDVEDVWSLLRSKYTPLAKLTFYEIPDTGLSLKPAPETDAASEEKALVADNA